MRKNKQQMITIATTDGKLKAEAQKHLRVITALMEKTQDEVLLFALRDLRKKIDTGYKSESESR